jgi:hypothetical protein
MTNSINLTSNESENILGLMEFVLNGFWACSACYPLRINRLFLHRPLLKGSSLNKEAKADESESMAAQSSEEESFQLDNTILDKFLNSMLPGLMKILGMY